MDFTTIKVPKLYVSAARRLQSEMLRRGVEHLPSQFETTAAADICPLCGSKMEQVASYQYLLCPCGMAKHRVDLSDTTGDVLKGIGVAALVGLGLYALGQMIGGAEKAEVGGQQAAQRLAQVRGRRARTPRGSTRSLVEAGRRR